MIINTHPVIFSGTLSRRSSNSDNKQERSSHPKPISTTADNYHRTVVAPLSGEAYYEELERYTTYRRELAEYQKWKQRYEPILEKMILNSILKTHKSHIATLSPSERTHFKEEAAQSAKEKVKTQESQDLITKKIETDHQLKKPAPVQKPIPTASTEDLFKGFENFSYEFNSART